MNKESNVSLEELSKRMNACQEQRLPKIERLKELRKLPIINEYEQLSSELTALWKEYESLEEEYEKLYQKNCEHPLWYFWRNETDFYEQRQLWVCQCVRCGMLKSEHSRSFKDKLILESGNMGFGERCIADYDKIKEEYLSYESQGEENEQIAKIMIKKYNYQKK